MHKKFSCSSVTDTARVMCAYLPSAKDAVTAAKRLSEACGICTMVHAERCHGPQFSNFCPFYSWCVIQPWRRVQCTHFTCVNLRQPVWYEKSRCSISFCRKCVGWNHWWLFVGTLLATARLDGRKYPIFLETVLPTFLGAVPTHSRRDMWYQQDGAPTHSTIVVLDYLNRTFRYRWISRGRPIVWPPGHRIYCPWVPFSGGGIKDHVYETPLDSEMDLVARIVAAVGIVRDMPGVFENVR